MTGRRVRGALGTLVVLLGLAPAFACGAETAPATAPAAATLDAILARASATVRAMETQAASWNAIIRAPDALEVTVSVIAAPKDRRRTLVSVGSAPHKLELARIIERDGFWYVDSQDGPAKYRPFEASFSAPGIMSMYGCSGLRFATSAQAGLKLVSADGAVALFNVPLEPAKRLQYEQMYSSLKDLFRRHPEFAQKPHASERMENLAIVLERGMPLKIDTSTGVLAESQTTQALIEISDFKLLGAVPEGEFDIAGKQWADHSSDISTSRNLQNIAMLGHNGVWRPGQPSGELDNSLLDLTTGEFRRVPFRGIACLGGCFLKDRKTVIVSGQSVTSADFGLCAIDLHTGANRRLAADTMPAGMAFSPILSPDGKTLAASVKGWQKLLDFQIVLIDLATDKATLLGLPADQAFQNWLPSGDGLLLMRRRYPDPNDDERHIKEICRMSLKGEITVIRTGDFPTLVGADSQTILFEGEDDLWHTCDLAGKNEKLLGDGLRGYAFPTASPDGTRVLMMRWNEAKLPKPVIVKLSDGTSDAVPGAPGLWAMPQWR